MDVSEEHCEKARAPIIVSESGSVMDASEEQFRNAPSPIVVSESGSVIEISDRQPLKASSAIMVGTLSKKTLIGSRCAIAENLSAPRCPEAEQQSKNVK